MSIGIKEEKRNFNLQSKCLFFVYFQSVIVKSIERNAANMYLTREILLGLKSDAKISSLHGNLLKGESAHIGLSLASLGEYLDLYKYKI